MSASLV